MPSRYPWQITVRNKYLGVSKVIKAMTEAELDWLAEAQLSKWREQEQRKRQQQAKEAQRAAAQREAAGLRSQAEAETQAAQRKLKTLQELLLAGASSSLSIDWEQLLDRRAFPTFQFHLDKPDRDRIRLQLLGPEPTERYVHPPLAEEPSVFEVFLPFLRRRRLERQQAAQEEYEKAKKRARADFAKQASQRRSRENDVLDAYNRAAQEYKTRLRTAKERHGKEREQFLARQAAHNESILAFRSRYEAGSAEAVERYAQMALNKSSYPDGIGGDPDVQFDEPSKALVISFWLPSPGDVPIVVEYRYVASRKAIKAVEMKQKEFAALYDDVVHQIALRTMHEVFSADYAQHIQAVVFNGWVRGIDGKTGNPFTSCILSCEVSRISFGGIDLTHVSPKECVRGLKGITAGPLAMLAPVKPIMDLKTDDDRFVESHEVMGNLRPQDNLAAMSWEDFEHLVRELFEEEFGKTGGEVRVTQASRDRGVDAIAFDPDPIRGGKFVIQAKRYNIVVPVSAVRDLYGTMIAEGATKGILVTTSYFGHDSREFAKDKPMTLIDGENLVYMFQKYGRNVHIALLPKGAPGRGAVTG